MNKSGTDAENKLLLISGEKEKVYGIMKHKLLYSKYIANK